jgi:N-acetylglucosamine kinase-like BadF-type ATPase
MIAVADSGSTKTSWYLFSEKKEGKYISTGGINPFFRTMDDIVTELMENLVPHINGTVEKVFFYGAGVVNKEKGQGLESVFNQLFGEVYMEVNSDLLASARATLGNESGIACILGTGSNSCRYNGREIAEHIPPLGFILGDEGSGAMLGKKMLADYLKGIMPKSLSEKFQNQFPYGYSGFLDQVYKHGEPNRFLAGLTPFLIENIAEEYCLRLVENSFDEFVKRNICGYSDYRNQKICFVGSIAYFFEKQLENVLKKNDLEIGLVIKEPLEGLIQFHRKNLNEY